MLKVILTKGLPGSGKSHWAKQTVDAEPSKYKIICKDDLRLLLDNGFYSKDAEKFVERARDVLILLALEHGKHPIIADTNLSPRHENHIRQLVKGKAEVEIKDFTDVAVETCIERDLKRQNSVGQKVIWRMYWQFLHKPKEAPVRNSELPDAVICDIDGTLAIHQERSPYEFEKCGTDKPNEAVIYALDRVDPGATIILCSGREGKWRDETVKWLRLHGIPFNQLLMRQTGDTRRDDIVKREIYEAEIKGKYNVRYILDDRDRIVSMWRSEGLPCWQVNYGDF